MQNVLERAVLGVNAGQETYLLTYLLTRLETTPLSLGKETGQVTINDSSQRNAWNVVCCSVCMNAWEISKPQYCTLSINFYYN